MREAGRSYHRLLPPVALEVQACAHAELVALEAMFARGTRLADIHAATL